MINLSFRNQHLSIKDLPATELPDFTVLTGINGSGKTHLLEAIRDGKVVVDGVSPAKIKLFNWNDLIPSTGEHANSQDLWNLRVTAADAASALIKNACNSITSFFPQAKFSGEPKLADISWLLSATQSEISEVAHTAQIEDPSSRQNRIVRFPEHRANIVRNATLQLSSQYGELIEHIKAFAEGKGCHFFELNESEIRHSMPPYWTPPDFLRYQFSDWFTSYHAAWERNRIDRFYAMEEGGGRLWRSDEEFIARFGRRPWEVTNEILKNAGLRYQFNHPTGPFDAPFILRLVDPVANIEIRTEDLSSGEKIILSIALLLHQSGTATGLAALPNLLLLDEIDAPLHPSFTRVLIQTLDETLVKKSGLKIILTTHSPSTVAMAPEESLYEVTRDPRGIVKSSQSHAIRGLTSGFISVAPSAVVVITESGFDAEVYGKLLQAVQRYEGDRQNGLLPLTFIPASRTDDPGVGGGCAQVDNWANKLNEFLSAFGGFRGLIDKDDGTREATEVVKVLNRYSIENYLLDPLTVAAVLLKEGFTDIFRNCPIQDSDVKKIPDLEVDVRQALVDTICKLAEDKYPDLAANRAPVEVKYLGGFTARIPQWVFDLRGHKSSTDSHCMEEVFREVLKPIYAGTKIPFPFPATDFHRTTVDMQSRILPALIPADLVEIFHALQCGVAKKED